jgi:phage tail-like protein
VQADRIVRLLPEVYQSAVQKGSVLDGLLAVMEALHAPVEQRLADLDAVFDPRRTDDAFVTMLASWLALDPVLENATVAGTERRSRLAIAPGNLRELVAEAAHLARSRGTLTSLCRFLELATGISGYTLADPPLDPQGRVQPFAARIAAPASAAPLARSIERIVAREKPAFTTVEIVYRST